MLHTLRKSRLDMPDTDKMQFVYNGKYLEYFEVGRTELLRATRTTLQRVEKRLSVTFNRSRNKILSSQSTTTFLKSMHVLKIILSQSSY